jgi:hypothetical protein|tara:strand:- start:10906 stop:11274 length:369 start_codon:yes stop_codon:yes gene_type:complete
MSICSDLIGLRYELGADGSNGQIDCIHLCYKVLEHLGMQAPPFKSSWYQASRWEIARDLLSWGDRVKRAEYDGDILLLQQQTLAFAVTWQTGIFYINRQTETVNWGSLRLAQKYHCFRMKNS